MEMAVDTFVAYVGVYPSVEYAEADYQLIKDLHTKAGMMDAYDAAVIEKRENGKVRITKKHETPTRVGGVLGGGVGLATGLVVGAVPVRRDRRRTTCGNDRRRSRARGSRRTCGRLG
jgi:uncharacterized membrane protein